MIEGEEADGEVHLKGRVATLAGQDSGRTRRKAPYLEPHGGDPDDAVHLHLLLLVAVHHSGGHDLVKPPGGVADDGGDVADDDADEVEQGVEEHQAPKLQASPNDAVKS